MDDEGNFADGFGADDGADVFELGFGKEWEVEFGDDGVAAIGVYDADEGVDATGFVHVGTRGFVFAKVKDLIAKAMAFLQNPKVF